MKATIAIKGNLEKKKRKIIAWLEREIEAIKKSQCFRGIKYYSETEL